MKKEKNNSTPHPTASIYTYKYTQTKNWNQEKHTRRKTKVKTHDQDLIMKENMNVQLLFLNMISFPEEKIMSHNKNKNDEKIKEGNVHKGIFELSL